MKKRLRAKTDTTILKNPKGESAYSSLVRLLSRRDHTEKELQRKLSRWYTATAVQFALEKAHEFKLIKDEQFLTKQFSEVLHRKSRGIHTINQTLKQKGLPPCERDEDRELSKCRAVLHKRFGASARLSTPERVKIFRHLTYCGFDSETINKAINQFQTGDYENDSL